VLFRKLIFWLSGQPAITGAITRRGMKYGFAQRFVPGESLAEACAASRTLNGDGRAVSLNQLGEYVSSAAEAEAARDSYLHILAALDENQLDGNISIKLTQLGLQLDADLCRSLAHSVAQAAAAQGRAIEMDMEGSADTEQTLAIYSDVQARHKNATVAIQAYLFRSAGDLAQLSAVQPRIRLVKGAYREPAAIAFQSKHDVDLNYCRLLDQLFASHTYVAIATQDPRMIGYAQAQAQKQDVPRERYEFQMMYGIRRDLQEALVREGYRVRIYLPFGEQWCPYFMRRLSERPANCWFVLRSLVAEGFRSGRG